MATLYGIKNCDTVKKAQRWLKDQSIEFTFHDFRADGLSETKVNTWLEQLPWDQLINKRSTSWKQLDPAIRESLNQDNATAVILDNPTLIKRPVLETGDTLHIGFKDADYQAIF